MYTSRELEHPILQASEQFPVLLLTGPRQVGKTTLLRHLCDENRRYVTLDDLAVRELAKEDPALFLQRFQAPLLIDEIQYAPELLPYIKMHVDDTPSPGSVWLTGSQHFHLMKGVSETLAGRVAIINMLGFSRRENEHRIADTGPFLPTPEMLAVRGASAGSSDAKPVFDWIWSGTFPALHAGPIRDRDLFYSSYLQTYLQRDVRDLTQVADQRGFLRFLKACAARTAQLLNLTELARDVDISPSTAKAWLSVLEASYQIALLPPYHSNVTKRLIKTPKMYFLDTGLCAYLTEWTSADTLANGAMAGALFETHVFAELLKSWWHRARVPNLYYFRDKDAKEIDFVIEMDNAFYPIEVKRSATPKRTWARQLDSLARLGVPIGAGGVICLSEELLPLNERTTVIPVGYL